MKQIWVLLGTVFLGAGCIAEDAGDVETTVYGRLKVDISYDTAPTNSNGDFVQWVNYDTTGGDQLAMTARETRLGVKLKQGDSVSGLIEFDLYGGTVSGGGITSSPAENKPTVLLRHVFAKLKLTDDLSVLAGRTADVFSPDLPDVLNYGWGWNCGNSGYRRPQVRVEYAKSNIDAQVALARAIGGEASGFFDFQARVGYTLKNDEAKLGVGGSIVTGKTYDATLAEPEDEVFAWCIDIDLGLGPVFVRGEYFLGWNLKEYLGNIGQGVDGNGDEIHSGGYWLQAGYNVTERITVVGGYMKDDPFGATFTDPADRQHNSNWYGNVRCKLNKNTEVGLEVSRWRTLFQDGTLNKNTRVQGSMIYTF